jgi:hypothetical protein
MKKKKNINLRTAGYVPLVQRKVKSGGSRGRRERKPRTQETAMADDAKDEGASEWTHKREAELRPKLLT